MTAYYNEYDAKAAAWLRELIRCGLIAPGEVDTRSIEDVTPDDLRGFTQCHFFAGIGVWSLALRRAGWPDDRPVWTGSCPCQPFSAAGKGGGFADERHLWPAFLHLIRLGRPDVVLGEQVASKDGLGWLDLVQADLEGEDYACGAVDTCAAGFGAPHIRQRLYWVADALSAGRAEGRTFAGHRPPAGGGHGRLSYPDGRQRDGLAELRGTEPDGADAGRPQGGGQPGPRLGAVGLADDDLERQQQHAQRDCESLGRGEESARRDHAGGCRGYGRLGDDDDDDEGLQGLADGRGHVHGSGGASAERTGCQSTGPVETDGARPGPTNGLWRAADWLLCRDAKWRPVEPGTFPLADAGTFRNRVAELRGAGNAVNLAQAQGFIEAYLAAERRVRLTSVSGFKNDTGQHLDIFA